MPHQSSATTETRPSPFAPASTAVVQPPLTPPQAVTPSPLGQLGQTLRQIVRDPLGTVVGMAKHVAEDLHDALFSITKEELENPQIRARLVQLGIDPDKMAPTADMNEVLLAQGRTAALLAGTAAGGVTGAGLRVLVGAPTTALTAAGHGVAEALAFGTVGGALTPVEEGQTRAGNVLTWNVIGVPLGTLGGLTSYALQKHLRAQGIKPELEAPEVTPRPPEFDAKVAAIAETPRGAVAGKGPEPVVSPTEVPVKTGDAVSKVLEKVSIGEKPPRPPITVDAIYTQFIDDLHPINQATKELLRAQGKIAKGELAPGSRLAGLDDPYVLARISRGSQAKATQFLETGALDFKTLTPVTQGLREILRPVAARGTPAVNELRAYLVSRRAVELAERDIKTPVDLDAARSVVDAASPDVIQAAEGIYRYQDAVLQYLQDSGAITEMAAAAMREANRSYVPFYRFIEELKEPPIPPGGPPSGPRRTANVQSGIQKIRGGEKLRVVDPLENIVRNTYALVSVADRHAVADALVRLADNTPGQQIVRRARVKPQTVTEVANAINEELAGAGVQLPEGAVQDLAATLAPSKHVPEGTFWVLRNGEKQYYTADAGLVRSLLDMDREAVNIVTKILSAPVSLQKAGFTAFTPEFAIRNPFRDQFSASVFSRYGFKPGVDLVRGIFEVLGQDQKYLAFRRSGGEHAALVRAMGRERVVTQKIIGDLIRKDTFFGNIPRNPLEAMRRVSEMMEEASRSQTFVRALAQEGDPRLAAFAAREATLDFQRAGYSTRTLNQVSAFFNPAVQDLDKIIRTFGAEGGPRAAAATAKAVGYITVPTMILYMLNRNDPNYQELSQARKDFFWNVPRYRWNDEEGRMEHTGKFVALPKPFLLGMIFATVPERVMTWIDKQDPESFTQLASNFLQVAAPSAIPTAIQPILEVMTNHDFFRDRPIIPEGEKRLIAEEQAGPLQGETVRLIGKAFNVSPRNVEQLVRGYTGGLGTNALQLVDAALQLFGEERPLKPERDLPIPVVSRFLQSFLVDEPTINSKSVERFYTHWEDIEANMATTRAMIKQLRPQDAKAFLEAHRAELVLYDVYVKTQGSINELRQLINFTRANKTLEQEEREQRILVLGRLIRKLAANANQVRRNVLQRLENQAPQTPSLAPSHEPLPVRPQGPLVPAGDSVPPPPAQ